MEEILGGVSLPSFTVEASITTLVALAIYISVATGVLSLIFPGTMAVGAYTFGGLAVAGLPLPVAVLAALVAGVVLGALTGVAVARLTGFSAAIATFAFAQIIQVFFQNFSPTGGIAGLAGIPLTTTWVNALAVATVMTVGVIAVSSSRAGLRWKAVELDELAAESVGLDVRQTRVIGQAAAGGLAAIAGVLVAGYQAFVDPSQFGVTQMNNYLLPAILGGIMTPLGPPVGAIVATYLSHLLDDWGPIRPIVFSLLVIVIILVRRNGLITWRRRHRLPAVPETSRSSAASEFALDSDAPGLTVDGIRKRFFGDDVLRGVSFEAAPGEVVGIVGANGAGKTTLINVLSGVFRPDTGDVTLGGRPYRVSRPHSAVARGLARTFQNLRLFPGLTVAENMLVTRLAPAKCSELLHLLNLTAHRDVVATSLPYGTQRRVEIARALALRPNLMMLDEPTAGMTSAESEDIRQIIAQFRALGVTTLVVDHNLPFIARVADRLIVMHTGEVLVTGAPRDVLGDPRVVAAYMGDAESEVLAPLDDDQPVEAGETSGTEGSVVVESRGIAGRSDQG